ncbi:metal ABC transporter permease [Peptostreptococcus faecalis]|uniref:metal ABC transporter permease n=1 Tax=Peptostreptococcus faecalis TaxID=2045015 RepID=UPI000C7DA162|nr:metal ABC transporter permease [Peptostreptococcus faecalis]
MEIIQSYTFKIISMGTVFLAISSAIIGSLNLYKGQSLIGDAIGHSTFPGIILAFMLFQTRDPWILFVGAMLTGSLSYFIIQISSKYSKIKLDSSLAVFLSGFFGIGMVLKSIIQGNPDFQGASQSGLNNYIFGQAAYMMESDVKLIVVVSTIVICIFFIFRKEIVYYIFDREFAISQGIRASFVEGLLLVMTIALVSIGLKAVGFILISSFLILPCVTANQWSKKFKKVILIASSVAAFSALIGTYFSSVYRGLSTGPTIIVVMGIITIISMLFGRYGIINKTMKLRRLL